MDMKGRPPHKNALTCKDLVKLLGPGLTDQVEDMLLQHQLLGETIAAEKGELEAQSNVLADRILALRQANDKKLQKFKEKSAADKDYGFMRNMNVVHSLNRLRYEHRKRSAELVELKRKLSDMYDKELPVSSEKQEMQRQQNHLMRLESEIAQAKIRYQTTHEVQRHYVKILDKVQTEHRNMPRKHRELKDTIAKQKQLIAILKKSVRVAKRAKRETNQKFSKMKNQSYKDRMSYLRERDEMIAEVRKIKSVKDDGTGRKSRNVSTMRLPNFARRMVNSFESDEHAEKDSMQTGLIVDSRVLQLEEKFHRVRKAIPGATPETVDLKIAEQAQRRENLKKKIDAMHKKVNDQHDQTRMLKEKRESLKWGGREKIEAGERYQKDLIEKVDVEEERQRQAEKLLKETVSTYSALRDGIEALYDLLTTKKLDYQVQLREIPENLVEKVKLCIRRIKQLNLDAKELPPNIFGLKDNPDFLEFLEEELERGEDDDELHDLLTRHRTDALIEEEEQRTFTRYNSSEDLEDARNSIKKASGKVVDANLKKLKRKRLPKIRTKARW